MNVIEHVRLRLEAVEGVAATLVQAWDAFDLIRGMSRQQEQQSADFAAYAMAAASAARGRNLLTRAPSILRHVSASPGFEPNSITTSSTVTDRARASEPTEPADSLASLASLLASRLVAIALATDDTAGRQACTVAAAEAGAICSLLDGR